MNFQKMQFRYRYTPNDALRNVCPYCGSPVKWIYDRDKGGWIPCDREPVLFFAEGGKSIVMYKGRMINHALLYKPGTSLEQRPMTGHLPHYYTCKGEM